MKLQHIYDTWLHVLQHIHADTLPHETAAHPCRTHDYMSCSISTQIHDYMKLQHKHTCRHMTTCFAAYPCRHMTTVSSKKARNNKKADLANISLHCWNSAGLYTEIRIIEKKPIISAGRSKSYISIQCLVIFKVNLIIIKNFTIYWLK
jgi:hypothetical protein